ncbi:MAG: uracil-xanthine permease [Parasporobacterium sp.]|nr:uracil-xanthine permease [Parasporobacterium sp.]
MNLTYQVSDKPAFGKVLVFALQQLLAILAATIAVPSIIGNGMSQSAALFGAGVGTIIYLLFTKFKSPVFLGSSFAFLGSMFAAFAGAVSVEAGYVGLIIGAAFAGLVYVVIAIVVKFAGVRWITYLMPAVVIGPTVAIIGLSLAGNAVSDALAGGYDAEASAFVMTPHIWVSLICALVTLFVVMITSVYGKKILTLIPFIIGIVAGYIVATIFTLIGTSTGNPDLIIVDFSAFQNMQWIPDFSFLKAIDGISAIDGKYIATIAVAYVPVAFVVFAEHIADHKNLSSIIGKDLLEEPGLHRTLLGDGVGSVVGAFFGGCPNTTYGESIGCVAITGNASVVTILCTAIIAIIASFVGPFVTFLSTIPSCVMGGVCITLYGFIAVSGLKMLQGVDLNENRNLFTASTILICGIGGMVLKIGSVTLTAIACALILGIIVNLILGGKKKENK